VAAAAVLDFSVPVTASPSSENLCLGLKGPDDKMSGLRCSAAEHMQCRDCCSKKKTPPKKHSFRVSQEDPELFQKRISALAV